MRALLPVALAVLGLLQAKCVFYYLRGDLRNIYTASIVNSLFFAVSWSEPRRLRPRGAACLFAAMFVNAMGEAVGLRPGSRPQLPAPSDHYRRLNLLCLAVLFCRCVQLRAPADCATAGLLAAAVAAVGLARLLLWLALGGANARVEVLPVLVDALFALNAAAVALFTLDLADKARRFRAALRESF